MGKLTVGQKAEKAAKLLFGMENPIVVQALAPRGFTARDKVQGWNLFKELGRKRLIALPTFENRIPVVDSFENEWYPTCRATLGRHYPEARDFLFEKLPQTGGRLVVLSVAIFLERLDQLASGQSPLGEDGVKARDLLSQRGLTPQVQAEMQAELDRFEELEPVTEALPSPAEAQAAEDALWAWYLEWSAIARLNIKSRRVLRSIGFLSSRRSAATEDDVTAELETAPTQPVASPATAPPIALVRQEQAKVA